MGNYYLVKVRDLGKVEEMGNYYLVKVRDLVKVMEMANYYLVKVRDLGKVEGVYYPSFDLALQQQTPNL